MTREKDIRSAVAQPLEKPAPPAPPAARRSLRSWTDRQRTTAVEALRYTLFVTWMKRLLPLGALALLAAVVVYALMPRQQEQFSVTTQQSGNLANDLTMTKPRFMGTDSKGNPFTVTAAEAVQDPGNRHRAELHQVQADLQLKDGERFNASAAKGAFDMDAGTLKLTGGLSLRTNTGYELQTESAYVDMKSNTVKGDDKVAGRGPLGSVQADSFYFDRLKQQVRLEGHVRGTLYPKKAQRK